mmetsp:Transcript_9083/g.28759  ORF Transcript_9083/g.28759 Transcript_9083/m.28759 type:complete len:250 (+) Transcript_9083:673-1422(+)
MLWPTTPPSHPTTTFATPITSTPRGRGTRSGATSRSTYSRSATSSWAKATAAPMWISARRRSWPTRTRSSTSRCEDRAPCSPRTARSPRASPRTFFRRTSDPTSTLTGRCAASCSAVAPSTQRKVGRAAPLRRPCASRSSTLHTTPSSMASPLRRSTSLPGPTPAMKSPATMSPSQVGRRMWHAPSTALSRHSPTCCWSPRLRRASPPSSHSSPSAATPGSAARPYHRWRGTCSRASSGWASPGSRTAS